MPSLRERSPGRGRDPRATRRAIIDAAGQLFADRGFSGVTAREVARDAGVALSAIPYHFGSMDALYRETLLDACQIAPETAQLATRALLAPPAEALRTAVRWAIADVSCAPSSWQVRLIYREEMDPTPAYRDALARKVVPEWNWLCEIVARAAGKAARAPEVQFGVITMYNLAAAFHLQRGMHVQLAPQVGQAVKARSDAFIECVSRLTLEAVSTFSTTFPEARLGKRRTAERAERAPDAKKARAPRRSRGARPKAGRAR
jgi:AcrR family transcriptional regulator